MPSSRPTNPSRSVVVALILIRLLPTSPVPGDVFPHRFNMRTDPGSLRHNGHIHIGDRKEVLRQQITHLSQKQHTGNSLICIIGIGKMTPISPMLQHLTVHPSAHAPEHPHQSGHPAPSHNGISTPPKINLRPPAKRGHQILFLYDFHRKILSGRDLDISIIPIDHFTGNPASSTSIASSVAWMPSRSALS